MSDFERRALDIVCAIPPGQVAFYGQIARLAGEPRRARHVGRALAHCHDPAVPWFRVVNAAGRISHPQAARQAERLRDEGVLVHDDRVSLKRYGWRPGAFAFA